MKTTTAAVSGTTAGILSNAGGLGAVGVTASSTVCWPLVIGAAVAGYGLAWIIEAGRRSQREMQEAIMAGIIEDCLRAQEEMESEEGKVIDITEE